MSHPPALANCCRDRRHCVGGMATMQNAPLLASKHKHGVAACRRSPTDPELRAQQFHSGNEHSLRRKLVIGGWPSMFASRHCQQIVRYHSDSVGCGHDALLQTFQMLVWQAWSLRWRHQFGGAQNAIGRSGPQKTVQYLYRFSVRDPFNWAKKPTSVDSIWSTETISPGLVATWIS